MWRQGAAAALLAATVQSNCRAPRSAGIPRRRWRESTPRCLALAARFATMFYGALMPDGQLEYCNAGQEPPIVVRAGGVTEALETGGPVVGLLSIATYEPGRVRLQPGDLVIICSDGVTEARNRPTTYGTDR
jgi:serine phosphatase RsbU (regulator of sigma subunit)